MEVSIPHVISDGKMSATVGSDKLPMYILIPRETTKKTMQRHILKNNADHSSIILQCSQILKEDKKKVEK